jgi:hypothetical protein
VGDGLTSISPVVSLFNPVVGAGVASVGMVLKCIGALGNAGKALTAREDINPWEIRRTIDGIRSDAGAIRAAYNQVRGAGNPPDRVR